MGNPSDSLIAIIKRYGNNVLQLKKVRFNDFGPSLTPLVWKALFDFQSAEIIHSMPKLNDETLKLSYFDSIKRSISKGYQRLRHLEEEELLIYIALPLSCIMLTATFFMKNPEPRIQKPRKRGQRGTLVEFRELKELNKSEISKFCNVERGDSKVMVVMLVRDTKKESEAQQEIEIEMKRQFFQKIQDYQYDPRRPEFFVVDAKKVDQSVA